MTRTYATPLAFKAALEARIAERARASGRTMNRVRQLLVMERFLVRVFATLDGVVLKGGLVLELRLERARTTRDIDLRASVDEAGLLDRLRDAARLSLGDHLAFEVARDADHPTIQADGLRYEGQRFRVTASLAGRRFGDVFGVDIAIGEPIVGSPQPIEGDDLPDLALLATVADLDGATLRSAIEATFAHRGTHAAPSSLPEPARAWEPVYARMAAGDDLPWRTLDELVLAVRAFLDPVLAGTTRRWDPQAWTWCGDQDGSEPEHAENELTPRRDDVR